MIDARAVIDSAARIADDVHIGPWTIIGPEVEIGTGTHIGASVVIQGPTKIGCNNQIFQSSSIGVNPYNQKHPAEKTSLEIGDNNIIREFCRIERGTLQGNRVTRIGNDNFLMSCIQIAHDCTIGNHVTFINHVSVAEQVTIDDYVMVSGFSTVHEGCSIGAYSFIGGGCTVTKDILPYLLVDGHEAKTCGLNVKGLKRNGFSSEVISILKRAYKIIFRNNLTETQAIEQLNEIKLNCSQVNPMIEILQRSSLGIVR